MGSLNDLKDIVKNMSKENPIGFGEWIFKKKLTEYQKNFLEDESNRTIFVTSRQAGKSTITSIKALRKAWCFDDQVILVVSRTSRQSKLLSNRMLQMVNKEPLIRSDIVKSNTEEIKFENGSVIYSLPGSPDTIRGYSANCVIVDEAAFVSDDVFTAIEPTLATTNGDFIVLSSPYKREGYFWRAWNSSFWSKHRVTCYENPLVTENFIEEFKKSHTMTEFRREMLAEFVDDESEAYITSELLKRAMRIDKQLKPNPEYDYIIGVDFARLGNDKTCFAIIGKRKDVDMNGELELVDYKLISKKPLTYTVGMLLNVIKEWQPQYVVCDSNGLGAGAYDILKEKLGGLIDDVGSLQGMKRTNLYMFVRELLQDDRLLMIQSDEIIAHFLNIDIYCDSNGRIRIIKKPGGNDDIADAIVFAIEGWRIFGYGSARAEVCDFLNLDNINKANNVNDLYKFNF